MPIRPLNERPDPTVSTVDYFFCGSPIEPRESRPFGLSRRGSLLAALLLGLALLFAGTVLTDAHPAQTPQEPYQP